MPQRSNGSNLLNVQPSKSLKSCLVFSLKEEVPLHSKSNICNTVKGVSFTVPSTKITFLLYLKLKISDYEGSGTSVLGSIPLLGLAMLQNNIYIIAVA